MLRIAELNTSIGEFQRNYIFKFVVDSYPLALNAVFPGAPAVAAAMDLYMTKGLFPESKHKLNKLLWGGEYGYWDGPVDNAGTGVLVFRIDADWGVYNFWKAWKTLGANDENGAALPKPLTIGQVSTYMVGVDKTTIQRGASLVDMKVNDVKEIPADKEGDGISLLSVGVSWDRRLDIEGGGSV